MLKNHVSLSILYKNVTAISKSLHHILPEKHCETHFKSPEGFLKQRRREIRNFKLYEIGPPCANFYEIVMAFDCSRFVHICSYIFCLSCKQIENMLIYENNSSHDILIVKNFQTV